MLTPAKNDPNREEELKRRKDEPSAFGSALHQENTERPKDWKITEDGGLRPAGGTKKTQQPKS